MPRIQLFDWHRSDCPRVVSKREHLRWAYFAARTEQPICTISVRAANEFLRSFVVPLNVNKSAQHPVVRFGTCRMNIACNGHTDELTDGRAHASLLTYKVNWGQTSTAIYWLSRKHSSEKAPRFADAVNLSSCKCGKIKQNARLAFAMTHSQTQS